MNLTLSVDDDLVERARQVASNQGTSLQALVREYISNLAGGMSGEDLAWRMEENWREADKELKKNPPKKWKFSREEIYAERLDRVLKGKK